VNTQAPYTDQYSLGAEGAYRALAAYPRLARHNAAGSLIELAGQFGEIRLPFEEVILAVNYADGYYSVTWGAA
jgi:hypothetical protein